MSSVPMRKVKVDALECRCTRCGGVWLARTDQTPVRCAKCGTPYWNVEKRTKKKS